MLFITKEIIDTLIEHAHINAPIEACGYLASRGDTIIELLPLTNVDAAAEHFSLDPKEQFNALRRIRSEGNKLKAVYHSHPASPARPSLEDIRLAFDPDISYVIVSLFESKPVVKSFLIKQGVVTEEDVIVVNS
jgi:proteasome lid subunit RPN8/RPN11